MILELIYSIIVPKIVLKDGSAELLHGEHSKLLQTYYTTMSFLKPHQDGKARKFYFFLARQNTAILLHNNYKKFSLPWIHITSLQKHN
jgi:hypothetical protein